MKKYTFILAISAIFALTACGSGSTTTESTDSTEAVVVDTTETVTKDTTVNDGGVVTDNQDQTVDGKPQHSLEHVK